MRINDWLTNRRQVYLNGSASDWLGVTSGVPQGLMLGPMLIIINIIALARNLLSKATKSIDCTKLGSNVICAVD